MVPTLFFAVAGLLGWSGVGKVLRPDAAGAALSAIRVPGGRAAGRILGAFEAGLGAWCVAAPAPMGAAVLSLTYLAFAGFVAAQIALGRSESSCGCFGLDPAPPSWLHVGVDLAAAAVGFGTAIGPRFGGLVPTAARLGAAGPPYVAGIVAAVALAGAVAASLPALFFSYRGRREGSP